MPGCPLVSAFHSSPRNRAVPFHGLEWAALAGRGVPVVIQASEMDLEARHKELHCAGGHPQAAPLPNNKDSNLAEGVVSDC